MSFATWNRDATQAPGHFQHWEFRGPKDVMRMSMMAREGVALLLWVGLTFKPTFNRPALLLQCGLVFTLTTLELGLVPVPL
jgi:hypothetical protein